MLQIIGEVVKDRYAEVARVDLCVLACGYESRARRFAELFPFESAERVALEFDRQRALAFQTNRDVLSASGFTLESVSDSALKDFMVSLVEAAQERKAGGLLSIFVDISSQSRNRLASLIEAIFVCSEQLKITVFFGYTPAAYSQPPIVAAPNVAIGPVSSFFAGWPKDPDLPLSLIIGLGYESDRALGAVEYLEPANVWALLPHSRETRYDASLRTANAALFHQIGKENVIPYKVEDPNTILALLAALAAHLSRFSSVLLLPSGPKILVLLALLLACERRDTSVWRVSAGIDDPPIDRTPAGDPIVVECVFAPQILNAAKSDSTEQIALSVP
jgi:hypothetical protein